MSRQVPLCPTDNSSSRCSRTRRFSWVVWGLFAIAYLGVGNAQTKDDEAVRATREAFNQTGDFPWYDRESDTVRRVESPPARDTSSDNRNTAWESTPRPEKNWSLGWFGDFVSGVVKAGFWIFIAAVLGVLIWLLVRVFLKVESKKIRESDSTRVQASSSDVDRVESLPFRVKQPKTDLLSEAQRQYSSGNYRDAMIYLFSYMLLHLDKRQCIHLAKGKTNRQYLWEVRPRPRLFELLENSMIAFEDVFFGDHDLKRSEFEACWQGLDEFHQLVNEGSGP